MIEEYSDGKNQEIMAFLLYQAEEHREQVENRSLIHYARFPDHGSTVHD